MRRNRVKQMYRQGETILNGWLSIPSSFSAEIMANQGFDSLTIDMQHGIIDYQIAVTMLQAISTTTTTPIMRVPWNEPSVIMKALDAGAYGIICPMVNTAEEARRLVHACRYPPVGGRSWGPSRAILYGGPDYGAYANDEILVLPMIETAEGLSNLDEILSVQGIDGVYVGPSDLAFSHGGKAMIDQTEAGAVEVQHRIARACRERSLLAAIHNGTATYAATMIAAGYDLVTVGSDVRFISSQATSELRYLRDRTAALHAIRQEKVRP